MHGGMARSENNKEFASQVFASREAETHKKRGPKAPFLFSFICESIDQDALCSALAVDFDA
jgi:hypothetical protein